MGRVAPPTRQLGGGNLCFILKLVNLFCFQDVLRCTRLVEDLLGQMGGPQPLMKE